MFKDAGGKFSTSVFWFTVANTAVTAVYLMAGWSSVNADQPNLEGLAWFTLAYAGILTGNKFANKLIGLRYGRNPDAPITEDSKR